MVDITYLGKLLEVLKVAGVSSYEEGGLKLYFNYSGQDAKISVPTQDHVQQVPINEAELPPDLRTDNINSVDTILNWSSSGDEGELPIPGTEEPPYKPYMPHFNDNVVHPRQMAMPVDPP